MVSEYEKIRAQNIARNKELLKSLGLDKPAFEPKEKPRQKAPSKKRKNEDDHLSSSVPKQQRVIKETENEPPTGLRRSSRNVGKKVDYKSEKSEIIRPIAITQLTSGNEGPLGRESGRRLHSPKVYGHIPGIAIGTWWLMRKGCSDDAVHAPLVAGISGGKDGAHSVVLNGGYDDDVDLGYAFTYTGSGGRDLKGTKAAPKNLRTAPQSSDQSFDHTFNQMLKRSSETKKPVRVVRGYKTRSKYAPSEGYRYDGLYTVERAWIEKGMNPKGYLVCKFAFKRLPSQPPLPVRSDNEQEDPADEEQTYEENENEESESNEELDDGQEDKDGEDD